MKDQLPFFEREDKQEDLNAEGKVVWRISFLVGHVIMKLRKMNDLSSKSNTFLQEGIDNASATRSKRRQNMNLGFWFCVMMVPFFGAFGILFAVLKGKAARFVSGFNALSKLEQEQYDKEYLARDMRNSFFLWMSIMLVGAILSLLINAYVAVLAYIVWIVLFFKEVHLDAQKAFEKYKIQSETVII